MRPVRSTRLLVVWSPDWPITVTGLAGAVAVTVGGRVLACSKEARAAGVRRRMPVRQAQARCPELVLVERDPAVETRVFERVVRLLEEVTPRLEVIRPGLAALSASGPARYAGGERTLAERIGTLTAEAGVQVRTGIADTLFAAALAARAGRLVPAGRTAPFLSPYPVGTLGHEKLTELLPRLGIETLGGFAALPARQVLSRFGTEGAAAQRMARGQESRGLDTQVPPQSCAVAVTLDPPADQLESLMFTARQLAGELHQLLGRAGAVCGQVEVAVTQVGGRELTRLWSHGGRLSAAALAERVRWQLEAWRHTGAFDSAAPDNGGKGAGAAGPSETPENGTAAGARKGPEDGTEHRTEDALGGSTDDSAEVGIVRLALIPHQLSAAIGEQAALWGERHREELERAAARLQVRLGHTAVTRALVVGGRGPAERIQRVPFGDVAAPSPAVAGPWAGQLPAPHPSLVYPQMPPVRLLDAAGQDVGVDARAEVSAPPAHLRVRGERPAVVTGWSGPWPLDESWWSPTEAMRAARLLVTTADGRAWLLRLARGHWWAEACY